MFLCVSGTSKLNLSHGTLIEAEILTSLPNVFVQLRSVLCQHLPCNLEMFLCVSGTSKKNLVDGSLIEAEILTSQLPMYVLNLAQFLGTNTLPQVCQHLPSSLEMFLCVSGTSKKNLVDGALIEAEILTFHLQCICSTWLISGHQYSALRCVSNSQVV